jgi:DNA-binding LytR/AlgR family response regulator
MTSSDKLLQVLIIDDEPPAVDELRFLLEQDEAIGNVLCAGSVDEAIAILRNAVVDAVFLDIEMPGKDGLSLARLLSQHPASPVIVFVTAYEQHAVEAFEIAAVDYVLKPVRADRLATAVKRVIASIGDTAPVVEQDVGRIAVESGGRTVFIDRSHVQVVEASRDYVKLHTADRSYLIRTPISVIESSWSQFGFVRTHRSFIVAINAVRELRTDDAGSSVLVGHLEVPVSRTYGRDLKQRLAAGGPR